MSLLQSETIKQVKERKIERSAKINHRQKKYPSKKRFRQTIVERNRQKQEEEEDDDEKRMNRDTINSSKVVCV